MPSKQKGKLGSREAAEITGLSERRIRQLAEQLHAERDEFGKFWFDPKVILAYAKGHVGTGEVKLTRARIAAVEAQLEKALDYAEEMYKARNSQVEGLRVDVADLRDRIAELEKVILVTSAESRE